jgi:hypothetical protein
VSIKIHKSVSRLEESFHLHLSESERIKPHIIPLPPINLRTIKSIYLIKFGRNFGRDEHGKIETMTFKY